MNVYLPMHLSPWQAFLRNTLTQWCLPFIIIGLLILSLICLFAIGNGIRTLFAIPAIICLILPFILLMQELKLDMGPDPRGESAYSDSSPVSTKTLYWDEWIGGPSGSYYHDDYLKLEHTDVKIARGHWNNSGVRITPLNPTGKAWMIVARHVQNSPKPHANIKMDVHLSYTKASVETPQGTKKYICYVKNIKPKVDRDCTVLKYKDN